MTATTSTEGSYAAPAPAGFSYEQALGHLLVVVPHSLERDVSTDYGQRNAVSADIHDVTAEETFEEILIFPRMLVASLRRPLGQPVLGTLEQGWRSLSSRHLGCSSTRVGTPRPWQLRAYLISRR